MRSRLLPHVSTLTTLTALAVLASFAVLAPGGCGGADGSAPPAYGNRVLTYAPVVAAGVTAADWPFFFAPEVALGPPGDVFDVASLGYDPALPAGPGGSIALGLGDPADPESRACAVDGAGADLVVYENPFVTVDPATGVEGVNSEVATVEVSPDGASWYVFPPLLNEELPLIDPNRYGNLAGVTPAAEGGDRFDLGPLIAANGLPEGFRACFVRITDGGTRYADFGNTQTDLFFSGADIDAVEALHPSDAAGLQP